MIEIHLHVSQYNRKVSVRFLRKILDDMYIHIKENENDWKKEWENRNLHPSLHSHWTDYY